jgi:hypothetical protein
MDLLQELVCGGMDWIYLAQDRSSRCVLVNGGGDFLSS